MSGSTIVTPLRACALVDALLRQLADLRELDAVVDAERERVIGDEVARRSSCPASRSFGQHVGQVELALRVVGVDLRERVEQRGAVERVDAGVDLADRELLGRRVALPALASTTRSTLPSPSRTTRPYSAGSSSSIVAIVAGGAALLVGVDERLDRLGA